MTCELHFIDFSVKQGYVKAQSCCGDGSHELNLLILGWRTDTLSLDFITPTKT